NPKLRLDYYSNLIEGIKSRNIGINSDSINLKLADSYIEYYDVDQNIDYLDRGMEIYSELIPKIDKKKDAQKYYDYLIKIGDLSFSIGKVKNDSELIYKKINNYIESLKYYKKDSFPNQFVDINKKIGDKYYYLYKEKNDTDCLTDAIKFYKDSYYCADPASGEYENIKKLYENCKKEVIDSYLNDKNYSKVIEIAEKELDSGIDEGSEEYSRLNILLGDCLFELSSINFERNSLLKSIEKYKLALLYFNVNDYPDQNYIINKKIYESSKVLYENQKNDKNLSNSVEILNDLIEYAKSIDESETTELESEKSLLILKKAEAESNKGDFSKALELGTQCLNYFDKGNNPGEYAQVQKLLGIVHYHLSSSQYKVVNLKSSLNSFKEA
ncbi:MAG: hypothetical protein GTO02_01605, partial [Candidatus Dadabacteria bacterium]|nr:hypothetical protein [Candidatus Dadabacteria bacterium]